MKIIVKLSTGKSMDVVIQKSTVTVGRSLSCDLPIADESLSRQHCLIEEKDSRFYVTDLSSSNGVLIHSTKIKPEERTAFESYHELTLGQIDLQVFSSDGDKTIKDMQLEQINTLTVTKPIKNSSRPQAPKSTKISEKKNRNLSFGVTGVIFVSLIGFLLFQLTLKDKVVKLANPLENNVPEKFKGIADNFKSLEEYTSLYKNKSCVPDPGLCIELSLKELGEGFVEKDNEYYIFFQDGEGLNSDRLRILEKSNDKDVLVMTERLLSSNFYTRFQTKEIAQIHLIKVAATNSAPVTVVRLHQKYFPNGDFLRKRLLSEIYLGGITTDTKGAIKNLGPFLKIHHYNL